MIHNSGSISGAGRFLVPCPVCVPCWFRWLRFCFFDECLGASFMESRPCGELGGDNLVGEGDEDPLPRSIRLSRSRGAVPALEGRVGEGCADVVRVVEVGRFRPRLLILFFGARPIALLYLATKLSPYCGGCGGSVNVPVTTLWR